MESRRQKLRKGANRKKLNSITLEVGPLGDMTFADFLNLKMLQVREGAWNRSAIMEALDVSKTTVEKWRSDHTHFPIDKLRELYEHTGDEDIPRFLGDLLGLAFFRLPRLEGLEDSEAAQAAADAMKEAADQVSTFLDVIRDGEVDDAELARLELEYSEASKALAVMMELARAIHGKSGYRGQ